MRTKTSGDGRKREELYLHIDQQAYVIHSEWLQVGWDLWAPLNMQRDFFLGVPTPDLSSMRVLEAKYSDGQAMSRALLKSLTDEKGEPLLTLHVAGHVGSEQSGRATLVSLAAS